MTISQVKMAVHLRDWEQCLNEVFVLDPEKPLPPDLRLHLGVVLTEIQKCLQELVQDENGDQWELVQELRGIREVLEKAAADGRRPAPMVPGMPGGRWGI